MSGCHHGDMFWGGSEREREEERKREKERECAWRKTLNEGRTSFSMRVTKGIGKKGKRVA